MSIPSSLLPLDADRIRMELGGLASCFAIMVESECASTNTRMTNAPPEDDGRIHVLVAEHQTAGRGRRGRQWLSWPGSSLSFSVLWRFSPGAPVPAGLSLVAGLAVARALENLGVGGVQLKWPNDVLVMGAKIAGILVELVPGRGRTLAAVIGIGLNVRLPPDASIPNQEAVTCLAGHLHDPPNRNRILARLLIELHTSFESYASAGFPALRNAWEQRNAHANLPVRITDDTTEQYGTCCGVADDGALLLRTETGTVRILSGEVSLRAC